jgi:dTDP-4-amino-4,6-dideoxygalactose transaminase
MPSFTFVSTANAFVLRGAKIVFADSSSETPNISASNIELLITPQTKAIVVVHYAGIACDMDPILSLAKKHSLFVVEDAAQAIGSFYKGKPLGGIGDLSAFSFHETKNIISGEGGMLVVSNPAFEKRAEIIWEKGTNRSAFFRGEVDKYGWVDVGSSFLPSEIISAFLFAQLEFFESIQEKRKRIWSIYHEELVAAELAGFVRLPFIPDYATNNAHIFYLVTRDGKERDELIAHLNNNGINAVFHYLSLHASPFYGPRHDGRSLPWSDYYTERLVRLPLYFELKEEEVRFVAGKVRNFFGM